MALACACLAPRAAAQPGDQQTARVVFDQAQAAFKKGDYKHSAEKFEEAYRLVPHHAPLWNAGRAWQRAGELTRAANTYAKYLREAPPQAPDRNKAIAGLKEISPKLAHVRVHGTEVTDITADGQAVEAGEIYLLPGTHVFEGKHAGETIRVTETIAAGESVSVALVPPPPPPSTTASDRPPPAVTPTPDSGAVEPARRGGGLPPIVFVTGAVLTAAAGGVTIWSGLDTLELKREFDKTQDDAALLEKGNAAQDRTNVLIGVTAGLGLLTVVTGIFLVDWRGGSSAKSGVHVRPGLGSLSVDGRF